MKIRTASSLFLAGLSTMIGAAAMADDPKTTPAATPATAPESKAAAPAEQLPKTTVELLDAGAEPRKVLRFAPTVGDEFGYEMVQKSKQSMSSPMGEQEFTVPPTTFGMVTKIDRVDDKGAEWTSEFVKIDMGEVEAGGDPQMAEMIKATMSEVLGMKIKSSALPSGEVVKVTYESPAKLPADAASMTESAGEELSRNMTPCLPDKAVGVGGKWKVHRKMKSGGMVMTQTETYTVKSIDGDKVSLSFEGTQNAEKQQIDMGAQASTMELWVDSHSGTMSGTWDLDLKRPAPTSATVKMNAETKLSMKGAQEIPMGQKVAMEATMSIKPKEAVMPKSGAENKDGAPADASSKESRPKFK